MLLYGTATKFIDLRHQTIQEITVVAHNDNRTIKIANCLLQDILRTHIQMVGRFVEDKEVHRFKQQLNHRQAGPFTATQHLDRLLRGLTAKHEGPQDIANFQSDIPNRHTVDGVEHRQVLIQQLRLVLRKVAQLHVMA